VTNGKGLVKRRAPLACRLDKDIQLVIYSSAGILANRMLCAVQILSKFDL